MISFTLEGFTFVKFFNFVLNSMSWILVLWQALWLLQIPKTLKRLKSPVWHTSFRFVPIGVGFQKTKNPPQFIHISSTVQTFRETFWQTTAQRRAFLPLPISYPVNDDKTLRRKPKQTSTRFVFAFRKNRMIMWIVL